MFEVLSGCNVIGHGIFGSMASNYEPPQPPNYDNIEMEGMGTLTLPNSLKAPIDRLQLLGNSTQGCTIKVLSTELEHGTINAGNGENFPSNYRVRTKGFSDIQKGKYKVTCEGAKQANIIFYSTDGIYKNTLFKAHTVFPFYFTANEACKIRVAVSNGTEEEAIAIKPENVKSITVATEATPEYPQEIKSVGRKSRNLFDISKLKSGMIPPENINIEESTITLPTGGVMYFNKLKDVCTDLKVGDEVYLFAKSTGTKAFVGFHNETISISLWNFNTKRTVTDEMLNSALLLYSDSDKSVVISDIMITKVNDKTYEPYMDKKLIDVNVLGRNLIDIDALRNENGYISGNYDNSRDIDHFNIVKGKRYLLITKGKPLVSDYSSVYFGDETLKYGTNIGDWLATATGYVSFTSDLEQNRAILTAKKTATITKMILHGKANTRKDDYDVEEFGLFEIIEDNTNIDYEPYYEPQTVQLQLDEPLRGIGEYKDVVTKDGILRKIKEIVLDENTGFTNHLGGTQNKTICFVTHILKDATNIAALNNAMSDKIEKVLYVDMNDKECFTLFNKQIYIKLSRERNIDTVEKLKEWLKQNPIKVQYLLQEPVLEMIENSLENLHANDRTTIITVDSGEVETGIKLTYRKEK